MTRRMLGACRQKHYRQNVSDPAGGGTELAMRTRVLLIGAVLAISLVGASACGQNKMSRETKAEVIDILIAFDKTAADTQFSRPHYESTLHGVDRLIALCRAEPDVIYDNYGPTKDDVTLRQIVEDAASTLRDNESDLADRLETAGNNGCK
jgi:hypothetical protein